MREIREIYKNSNYKIVIVGDVSKNFSFDEPREGLMFYKGITDGYEVYTFKSISTGEYWGVFDKVKCIEGCDNVKNHLVCMNDYAILEEYIDRKSVLRCFNHGKLVEISKFILVGMGVIDSDEFRRDPELKEIHECALCISSLISETRKIVRDIFEDCNAVNK